MAPDIFRLDVVFTFKEPSCYFGASQALCLHFGGRDAKLARNLSRIAGYRIDAQSYVGSLTCPPVVVVGCFHFVANVELTGAARLYRAASSERSERG